MSFAKTDDSESSFVAIADKKLAPFEDFLNLIAAAAILMLMFLGAGQIFLRSVLNSPIAGYIDLVELSMASMAFLGAAYCQRLGAHIRMELLLASLKGRWLWGFEIISTLVGLFIIGVLIWYGWEHFVRSYQLGDSTIDAEYPVWPSKLLVPIAFAFWFLRLLVQLAGSIRLFVDPSASQDGIARILDVAEQAQEEIHEAFNEDLVVDANDKDTPQ